MTTELEHLRARRAYLLHATRHEFFVALRDRLALQALDKEIARLEAEAAQEPST